MQATITKFLSDDKQIRLLVLDNTAIIQQMVKRQPLKSAYTEALATCFSLSSIVCGTLKDRQRLSVRLNTSAPYECFHCDIQSNGLVGARYTQQSSSVLYSPGGAYSSTSLRLKRSDGAMDC